tara:strand:- start:38 stop:562 length:525 start_codon:yes stop_codon:yes gene_type:complete
MDDEVKSAPTGAVCTGSFRSLSKADRKTVAQELCGPFLLEWEKQVHAAPPHGLGPPRQSGACILEDVVEASNTLFLDGLLVSIKDPKTGDQIDTRTYSLRWEDMSAEPYYGHRTGRALGIVIRENGKKVAVERREQPGGPQGGSQGEGEAVVWEHISTGKGGMQAFPVPASCAM